MLKVNEFKDKFTKQAKINDISRDIIDLYEQYQRGVKYQLGAYEKEIKDLNTQLSFLGQLQQTYILPLSKQLYALLASVGSPSRKPSTTLLLTDHKRGTTFAQEDIKKLYQKTMKLLKKQSNKYDSLVKQAIYNIKSSTVKAQQAQEAKDQLKQLICEKQTMLNQRMIGLERSLLVATKFREINCSVKEQLEQVIIPELTAVQAFLVAESIKTSITNKETNIQPVPESIILIANGSYRKHYLFTKDVFAYYTLLLDLCDSPMIAALEQEKEVTQDDIEKIETLEQKLSLQFDKIKGNVVFA